MEEEYRKLIEKALLHMNLQELKNIYSFCKGMKPEITGKKEPDGQQSTLSSAKSGV